MKSILNFISDSEKSLQLCMKTIQSNDAIVLIDQGWRTLIEQELFISTIIKYFQIPIYMLNDAPLVNSKILKDLNVLVIDYDDLVLLTQKYQLLMSW